MRILAICRHYSPDTTPYARILRTILEHFAKNGHATTVITCQPGYNDVRQPAQPWREMLGGVEVRRVRLMPERKKRWFVRFVNFIYFLTRAVLHAIRAPKYDLLIGNTYPPVLMGCAMRVINALRGTPYIYHCMDIHPEAALLAGDLRRGWLYRWLVRSDTKTCRKARCTIVLSRDMADTLIARGLSGDNVSIINNPPLVEGKSIASPLPAPFDDGSDTVRFLFAGNCGRFQGLERLVAAARLVPRDLRFQLVFMGEGSSKQDLVRLAGDELNRRVFFIPQQPVGVALAAMRKCDYGIVTLMADVYRFAYPSKTMTYWAAGCPVLALIELESELAMTIERHRLGQVTAGNSVASIVAAISTAIQERRRWSLDERCRIAHTCDDLFGSDRMLQAWERLIFDAPADNRSHAPVARRQRAA